MKRDYIHEFKGRWNGVESRCRIRIYEGAKSTLAWNRVVVIATQLGENPGVSVTNAAEQLATEVCQQNDINPMRLLWVEHYPEREALRRENGPGESFDEVTFDIETRLPFVRGNLLHPKWRHLGKSREIVEGWIGGPL